MRACVRPPCERCATTQFFLRARSERECVSVFCARAARARAPRRGTATFRLTYSLHRTHTHTGHSHTHSYILYSTPYTPYTPSHTHAHALSLSHTQQRARASRGERDPTCAGTHVPPIITRACRRLSPRALRRLLRGPASACHASLAPPVTTRSQSRARAAPSGISRACGRGGRRPGRRARRRPST